MKPSQFLRAGSAACLLAVAAYLMAQQPSPAPKPLTSFDPQVKALLAQMTLDEKIGQMTQPDQEYIKDLADIENLFLGSILSGGSSDPKEGNSLQAWTDLYDRSAAAFRPDPPQDPASSTAWTRSTATTTFWTRVIFPHNIGLGCTRNAALVEKIERITAEEVRASGIQWAFRALRDRAAGHPLGTHL